MSKIAIITAAGSLAANQVLAGVYGSLVKAPNEQGPGTFRIDPEFMLVSYLFSLMEGREAPVTADAVRELDVPDEIQMDVKAYLMHSLGSRWEQLYSKVTPSTPGMTAQMLTNEKRRTLEATRSHLISMGMHAFMVPMVAKTTLDVESVMHHTTAGLLNAAGSDMGGLQSVELDTGAAIIDVGVNLLGTPHQQTPQSQDVQVSVEEMQSPAWAQFETVDVTFKGTAVVVARDMAHARQLAEWCVHHANSDSPVLGISLQPTELVSVQEHQFERSAPAWQTDNAYQQFRERL